jgi:anti-anti-sigma factor
MAKFFKVSDAVTVRVIELELPANLDVGEFDKLNDTLLPQFSEREARWVLDLSKVEYVGSAVLGMMVNIRQHVKGSAGKLVLCCLSPTLMEIFQACCMERLFTIAKNRQDAVKKLG